MVKQRKDRPNNVSRHFSTSSWRRVVEALGLRQARISYDKAVVTPLMLHMRDLPPQFSSIRDLGSTRCVAVEETLRMKQHGIAGAKRDPVRRDRATQYSSHAISATAGASGSLWSTRVVRRKRRPRNPLHSWAVHPMVRLA